MSESRLPNNDGRGYLQGSTMTAYASFSDPVTGEKVDPPTVYFAIVYRDGTRIGRRYDNPSSGSDYRDPQVRNTAVGDYECDFPLSIVGRAYYGAWSSGGVDISEEYTITISPSQVQPHG